jgi:DNA-binding MarR family transcriptional regulator
MKIGYAAGMPWGFLTNHARALLCIAGDPGVRLREIATTVGITERAAFGIVDDLVVAGYVHKDKQGRRNRYTVQAEQALPEALLRERTVGQLLRLLSEPDTDAQRSATSHTASRSIARSRSRPE